MISVLNVTKHFDEVHALSEVDLDIATRHNPGGEIRI